MSREQELYRPNQENKKYDQHRKDTYFLNIILHVYIYIFSFQHANVYWQLKTASEDNSVEAKSHLLNWRSLS